MPIYAYKCEACGYTKDVLQKMSDAPLTACPHCGAPAFKKQVTAAGFQLKGSGWYVTDFRGGAATAPPAGNADAATTASGDKAPASASASEGAAPAATPAASPAAAPASGAGSSGKSEK